jgi:hypothetical protein
MKGKNIRVGGGAGFEEDIFEPAVILAQSGNIQYLGFETLAERTLAFAQKRKLEDPTKGYNPLTEARVRAVLPACVKKQVKIISNFGAANPLGAAEVVARVIQEMGYSGLKIATIIGDDVRHLLTPDSEIWETKDSFGKLQGEFVSANAYIGAEPIVTALEAGADIVITGRAADPSLFLAPMMYEFGWRKDDWDLLGAGIVVGHLLECSPYVTGGYYFDPGYTEDVPDIANIGYPIAEVYEDGEAIITKAPGTGGVVSPNSCKAQLVYEIHDPSSYLTPDVVADFSNVKLEQVGKDQVRVSGARGRERPTTLKVTVGVMEGYIAEGELGWAGPGSYEKAKVTAEAIKKRLEPIGSDIEELRVDFIGVNSIFGSIAPQPASAPNEVRLRIAGKTTKEEVAKKIIYTFGFLMAAPVGAGGPRTNIRPVLGLYSTLMPREKVVTKVFTQRIDIHEVK